MLSGAQTYVMSLCVIVCVRACVIELEKCQCVCVNFESKMYTGTRLFMYMLDSHAKIHVPSEMHLVLKINNN